MQNLRHAVKIHHSQNIVIMPAFQILFGHSRQINFQQFRLFRDLFLHLFKKIRKLFFHGKKIQYLIFKYGGELRINITRDFMNIGFFLFFAGITIRNKRKIQKHK